MEENITVEFVKEWIEKHNLSKGSFDRIMRDLIYNSGHNQIDNPYLRDWLIKNTQKFQDILPIELNENQQVVFEWLKDDFKESGNPVDSLESLASEVLHVETFQTCISSTYDDLSTSEQFEVLAAFAEWGMKEVAE